MSLQMPLALGEAVGVCVEVAEPVPVGVTVVEAVIVGVEVALGNEKARENR